MKKNVNVVAYVHGFNSSHRSFGYLLRCLPEHKSVLINYSSHQSLSSSLDEVARQLPESEIALVGHSLGGVISAILAADRPNQVKKLVTISSPLRGSRAARALKWLPGAPLVFSDIVPHGRLISKCTELELDVPTLSIISTGGHLATSPEPNDSIVSIASQKALKFGKKVEVNANHFEVLQHEKTADAIKKFLFDGE